MHRRWSDDATYKDKHPRIDHLRRQDIHERGEEERQKGVVVLKNARASVRREETSCRVPPLFPFRTFLGCSKISSQ